jgi:hypothetical protein
MNTATNPGEPEKRVSAEHCVNSAPYFLCGKKYLYRRRKLF